MKQSHRSRRSTWAGRSTNSHNSSWRNVWLNFTSRKGSLSPTSVFLKVCVFFWYVSFDCRYWTGSSAARSMSLRPPCAVSLQSTYQGELQFCWNYFLGFLLMGAGLQQYMNSKLCKQFLSVLLMPFSPCCAVTMTTSESAQPHPQLVSWIPCHIRSRSFPVWPR